MSKLKKTIFTGAATAIITPFKNGNIDYTNFKNIIEQQINGNIDAIVVAGTTGEAATLTHEEHMDCMKFVVDTVAGRVPVIAGTGSNDTAYARELSQYACEIGADAILLAKNVDGVYTADPRTDPTAVKYDSVPYAEVLEKHLNVMDMTATSLAMDNKIPAVVFPLADPENIVRAVLGENVGTTVTL